MDDVPILVHRISPTGGRQVVIRIRGTDTVLGVAHSDRELVKLLRHINVLDPEELVYGRSPAIAWQGGRPHVYKEPEET